MRFVVFGAGAIGGVVGGRVAQHGHSVVLIARGAQYEAIRNQGLRIESPAGVSTIPVPVVEHPARLTWTSEDVVLLTTKSQDTAAALESLSAVASPAVPIFCLQNGVANERTALRLFANVYAVYVWCPTGYLTPGVVQAWCAPVTGIFHAGRYPAGSDTLADNLTAAFRSSSFYSQPRHDVMRWKYRKLLSNLGNALEALCGPAARGRGIAARARAEALECFAASGITFVADDEEHAAEQEREVMPQPINGVERQGGSTWQSVQRQAGSIETDYLNGEICLLGRLHAIATPVNALLQRLSRQLLVEGKPPGSVSPDEILRMIDQEAQS